MCAFEAKEMRLTHLDDHGRPLMVDVGEKQPTLRTAEAEGWVRLDDTICALLSENEENTLSAKGDVLRIAETAGIMAIKKTWELIPLCHALRIECARVQCELMPEIQKIYIRSSVKAHDVTGVEMEALTGVSVAALTVYDMYKAVSKGMIIDKIQLLSKTGGKSGDYCAPSAQERALG